MCDKLQIIYAEINKANARGRQTLNLRVSGDVSLPMAALINFGFSVEVRLPSGKTTEIHSGKISRGPDKKSQVAYEIKWSPEVLAATTLNDLTNYKG